MDQVGMRELRHRLREYLARVEAGERFEVTVFGRKVAELVPAGRSQRRWERLLADGRLTPPLDTDDSTPPPLRPAVAGMTATAALLAERGEDLR